VLYEDLIYLWLGFLLFEFFPETKVLTGIGCLFLFIAKELGFLALLSYLKRSRLVFVSIFANLLVFLFFFLDLYVFSLKYYMSKLPLSSLLGFFWFLHYYLLVRIYLYRLSKGYIRLVGGMILPIVLIILAQTLIESFGVGSDILEWIILLVIFGFSPYLMIKVFPFEPLEDPYWKELLTNFLRQNKIKLSGIFLLKDIGKPLYTAGIIGFLPGARYLFFSLPLLQVLTPEEVMGVLGHEIGHIKRRHTLWLLLLLLNLPLFLVALLGAMVLVASVLFPAKTELIIKNKDFWSVFSLVYFVGASFLYIRYVFAYFLRQFEREADVYACCVMGSIQPVISALYKIGQLTGQLYKKSWHHYGVAERIEFLTSLKDPKGYLLERGKKLRFAILAWMWINIGILWVFSSEHLLKKVSQFINYIL